MKKLVEWGSPKYYQKGWESESTSNPTKLPKPKAKYCKKLKGSHRMELRKTEIYKWHPPEQKKATKWEEFRCVACNKKEIKSITIDLEG